MGSSQEKAEDGYLAKTWYKKGQQGIQIIWLPLNRVNSTILKGSKLLEILWSDY